MITLGSRSFAGPFMAPLWSPPKAAAVYAVLAPGWRLLTFRAHELAFSTDAQRAAVVKELSRGYRPEFKPLASPQDN